MFCASGEKRKPLVNYFSPFNADTDKRSCQTCAYSIGFGEHHVSCQLTERVPVFPCGRWQRGAGCDEPEREVAEPQPEAEYIAPPP